MRLAAPTARAGDPVRILTSGVEIEAVITDASTPVLHVRVKPAAVTAGAAKTKRTRTGSARMVRRPTARSASPVPLAWVLLSSHATSSRERKRR